MPHNHRVKSWLGSALGLLVMVAALATKPGKVDDFPAFYNAALHPWAVYSAAVSGATGRFLPYLRIPSYAWMLQPVAALPYPVARVFWLIMIATALACFVFLWPGERTRNVMALCWSFPVAFGFALGQDTGFVLLIAAIAVYLRLRNHNLAAGLVIATLAFKITFLPAVAIPFLRSRRAVIGLALGLVAQLGLCFAIDPAWLGQYFAILRSRDLDPEPLKMLSIRGISSVLPFPGVMFVVGFVFLMAWMWRIAGKAPIVDSVSSSLAIALIAAPHCYVYDGILLIPLFAKFASTKTWPGRAALFGLSPLPFLAILAGGSRPIALVGSSLLVISTCVVLICGSSGRHAIEGTRP